MIHISIGTYIPNTRNKKKSPPVTTARFETKIASPYQKVNRRAASLGSWGYQPQSILNIFLTFLVAYTLWQPFVAYFRSDIDIIVFFCWAGWKWVGRRDCLTKKNFFFTSSGAQRWAEREMGNTKKNTATLIRANDYLWYINTTCLVKLMWK